MTPTKQRPLDTDDPPGEDFGEERAEDQWTEDDGGEWTDDLWV